MHGLEKLNHLNRLETAKLFVKRYEKLRDRAIKRRNWFFAKRWDGRAEDFRRYADGEITVWPGEKQAKKGRFKPAEGRDFNPGESEAHS